jgi:hypothetical protein
MPLNTECHGQEAGTSSYLGSLELKIFGMETAMLRISKEFITH